MALVGPSALGDCSSVRGELHNVTALQATDSAFTALRADGTVISWGQKQCGGKSPWNARSSPATAKAKEKAAAKAKKGKAKAKAKAKAGADLRPKSRIMKRPAH